MPSNNKENLHLFSTAISVSLIAVRIPSPVVAYLEKIICPEGSPPSVAPVSSIFSYTKRSPTRVFSPFTPKFCREENSPPLDITVATIVFLSSSPRGER